MKRMPLLRFSVTSTPFGRVGQHLEVGVVADDGIHAGRRCRPGRSRARSDRSACRPSRLRGRPRRSSLTALAPQPGRLGLDRRRASRSTWNGSRLPGKISVGRSSFEKPTTPTLTPSNVSKTVDGFHSAGVFPLRVDDVRRHEREVRQRDQRVAQVGLALVEVVVAQPVGVEAHHVHDLDRRRVAEEARDRRRRPDRVAAGHRDRAARRLGAVDVEPRLQEGRAADREGRVGRAGAVTLSAASDSGTSWPW